jgi:hypothetical protein
LLIFGIDVKDKRKKRRDITKNEKVKKGSSSPKIEPERL